MSTEIVTREDEVRFVTGEWYDKGYKKEEKDYVNRWGRETTFSCP